MECKVAIVKLGGSLVTIKAKPLTPNMRAITNLASCLSALRLRKDERLFLIHGGGSYGHYYAKKFGLSTRFTKSRPEAIAKICNAMLELHSQILDAFTSNGFYCRSIDSAELLSSGNSTLSGVSKRKVEDYLACGLTPLSYGNVFVSGQGARIISGDEVCLALARSLSVSRVIFAMDVDGVYSNPSLEGDVIPILNSVADVHSRVRRWDVTGGLGAKLKLGFEISRLGVDVCFLNGLFPDRIRKAISGGENFRGSMIRASSGTLKE